MSPFRSTKSEEDDAGLFSLTQIRHLMRVEFSRAQRYGYSVSCLVIMADRLANLRDLYGFEAKETLVGDVVALVQRETRACDFLGRLVDDRLVAVLPHTGAEGAKVTADRIRLGASGLQLEVEGSPVRITLSVGSSHFEEGNTLFFDALLEAAEDAAEQASGAGGDRFLHLNPSAPAT